MNLEEIPVETDSETVKPEEIPVETDSEIVEPEEIPVETDSEIVEPEEIPVELKIVEPEESCMEILEKEKEKSIMLEDKLARTLADFQNLEKQMQTQIQNSVTAKLGQVFNDILRIQDDFERARNSFAASTQDTAGLDSILKNISSVLTKYGVQPMDEMGEIFNPQIHEAISTTEDDMLDEGTITKVIRKGYILHDNVVRTSLVEISKKPVVN